jgi:multiple sugar transport system permease protein
MGVRTTDSAAAGRAATGPNWPRHTGGDAATGRNPGRRRRGPARRRGDGLAAWLFALPFVAVFAVFMLAPLISSFAMSFTDFRSTDVRTPFAVDFVGLRQYSALLADPLFRKAMVNTAIVVVFGLPLTMAAGLALAVALSTGVTRLRSMFRIGFYTPVVTSIVAVAVAWRYILQPGGPLNEMLGSIGIPGPNWLHSTTWALPSLVVLTAWRNMGTLMVIFLAGLQAIPGELHEAAAVDGASPWQRLRKITLPLLRPTLVLGAVLLSVAYLQFFEESFVTTQGGPLDSTLSISYFTYNEFGFGNYGYASAASYVLFFVIAALSAVQLRALRQKD